MKVKVKGDKEIELQDGSTAFDLAEKLNLRGPDKALAAQINGTTVDLSTPLQNGDEVALLNFSDPEGQEIYWHSSAHILAQAVLRLFPDAKPTIGPPIENGFYYDFADLPIHEEDLPRIENEMKKIAKENHRSEKEEFDNKNEAISHFKNNPYKVELIESFEPEAPLSGYRQGEFFDLCRGPHIPSTGKVKAIKVLKTAGAYWRGDSKNEMLTRIYAITFPDRKDLKAYLDRIELAKKRDHKVLGPKLGLFSLHEESPGIPFIHPAGMIIWNRLVGYITNILAKNGYIEIKTPCLMTKDLWVQSGHWDNYREHMFISEVEDRELAIKPMNCPGGMIFYKSGHYSYRDLPLRVAEIGLVHRFEPSGALSGLFRVRGFHQDDAHIFMRPSDIESEILNILRVADEIYSTFGLKYRLELSTKPEENTIGSDQEWEQATQGLQGALDKWGKSYKINEGDGAFYGPKIDFHVEDALERSWQCGTVQLDMALPERFDLLFTDEDGQRKRPIMIHRALFGSIERFFGILIEHFGGRFPLWLSPRQIRILTVADRHLSYAEELKSQCEAAGLLTTIDSSNESISKKVRQAQLEQVNYILTVGDKETEEKTVSLRTREGSQVHGLIVKEMLVKLEKEIKEKIHTPSY